MFRRVSIKQHRIPSVIRACLVAMLIATSLAGIRLYQLSQAEVWQSRSGGAGVVEIFLDAQDIENATALNMRRDGKLRTYVWFADRLELHRFRASDLHRTTIEITGIFADPFEKGAHFAQEDTQSRSIKLNIEDLEASQRAHVRNKINAGLRRSGEPQIPGLLINHQPQYSAVPPPWALVPWRGLFIAAGVIATLWLIAEIALAKLVIDMRRVRNKCTYCGYPQTADIRECAECGSKR